MFTRFLRKSGKRFARAGATAFACLLAVACTPSVSPGAQTHADARFSGWTGAVVSADWTDSVRRPIDAFDNARRDLTSAFIAAGFDQATFVNYSLRPDVRQPTTPQQALNGIAQTARRGTAGCFLYFTSHGSPRGIVFGPGGLMAPSQMASLVDQWCGTRPTVVVVSACYSGVFVPALAAPNRMVVTAARPDRNSFGCSQEATYPYFDGCMLEGLRTAGNFVELAEGARTCVSRREREERLSPPSEPQISIGSEIAAILPGLTFRGR